MAENSKIEWCDHTVNLWWGCTRVHAGCDNCYAAILAHRYKSNLKLWDKGSSRMQIESAFNNLDKYQLKAARAGEVHRVFINSMSDIFEKEMPLINKEGKPAIDASDGSPIGNAFLRNDLFDKITAGFYPNLIFLLLTKRPGNINKMIPHEWLINPPANVLFGTSPVDQPTANTLIPQLLNVAGKKFLSVEPMLGPINLQSISIVPGEVYRNSLTGMQYLGEKDGFVALDNLQKIDWVICGGESGPARRPFDIKWAYYLRDQCVKAGVPFFMKQIDKVIPVPEDLMIRQFTS